jgi:DNA-binding protein YbaB
LIFEIDIMFDKVKQGKELLKLRQQAKKLQDEMEQISHMEEDGEIQVVVNGTQNVVSLKIDDEEQERLVKVINKAMKEVQKKSAKRMMEQGGGLGGLLGGMGQ